MYIFNDALCYFSSEYYLRFRKPKTFASHLLSGIFVDGHVCHMFIDAVEDGQQQYNFSIFYIEMYAQMNISMKGMLKVVLLSLLK